MSASQNTEAVSNQMPTGGSGEFKARVAGDEPMMTGGHQPGKLVGNDAVPEFSAETLPAGTAPASRTFQPQNDAEASATENSGSASAEATLGGATSGDVHTGLGHPGQGQTSAEVHHDGQAHRKNPGASLEGVGAGAAAQGEKTE